MAKDLNFTYLHWRYWWTYIEGIDGPTLKVLMDLHWRYGWTYIESMDGPVLKVLLDQHCRYWWTYIEGIDGPTLKILMDLHWRYGRTCVESIDSIFGPTLGVWMDLHWRYGRTYIEGMDIPTLEVWMAVAFAQVAKRFDPIFGRTKRVIECRVKRILSNRSNKKKENLLH